jgi:hypothetical protein
MKVGNLMNFSGHSIFGRCDPMVNLSIDSNGEMVIKREKQKKKKKKKKGSKWIGRLWNCSQLWERLLEWHGIIQNGRVGIQ